MVTFDELPQEVLLETFSHLKYEELKKCMRVNKAFKTFLEQKAFDKVLFRSKEVMTDKTSYPLQDKLLLHPLFDHFLIAWESESDIDNMKVTYHNKEGNCRTVSLMQVAAANEHATSPPVNALYLQHASQKPVLLKEKTGVTVLQVMRCLRECFTQQIEITRRPLLYLLQASRPTAAESRSSSTMCGGKWKYHLDAQGKVTLSFSLSQ